jgi:hypothetical protein
MTPFNIARTLTRQEYGSIGAFFAFRPSLERLAIPSIIATISTQILYPLQSSFSHRYCTLMTLRRMPCRDACTPPPRSPSSYVASSVKGLRPRMPSFLTINTTGTVLRMRPMKPNNEEAQWKPKFGIMQELQEKRKRRRRYGPRTPQRGQIRCISRMRRRGS